MGQNLRVQKYLKYPSCKSTGASVISEMRNIISDFFNAGAESIFVNFRRKKFYGRYENV